MYDQMDRLQLIATSTMGLESVVSSELRGLGFDPKNSDFSTGRTYFQGNLESIVKANLHLRTAGKVLIELGQFDCTDFDTLFDAVQSIRWEDWIPRNGAILVDGRSVRSSLTSVPALQRTVKKAIVQRLMTAYKTSVIPEDGAQFGVEISLLKNRAFLTLDTTGRGLHRRGYRLFNAIAPLRETLAAALVILSNWTPDRQLIDPFCASGTIPIEAAMIARRIAPGLNRQFDAQLWPAIPQKMWIDARNEAREMILPKLDLKIIGYDIDGGVLKLARTHAKNAGVEDDIHFQQQDFADLTSSREYGCVICNPPYGDRLGEMAELRPLYESIPAVLSRLPTWSHYIITAWTDFEKLIGQEADRRRKLYNSRIECTYFQFLGPNPRTSGKNAKRFDDKQQFTPTESDDYSRNEDDYSRNEQESFDSDTDVTDGTGEHVNTNEYSPSDVKPQSKPVFKPAFAGLDEYSDHQAEEFGRCLANRARHLRRFPKRGITCYRLYERDLPEVPLAIDIYEGEYLHIAEFDRPDGRNVGQHRLWLDKMTAKAGEVLSIAPKNIFLKRRQRQRGENQYEKLSEQERIIDAKEGGLTFLVNMTDYLDTGLFLDHRLTRQMVREEAAGKRFLNLFCYTGSFSCYAAAGKASLTVSVDLSPTYLDWAEANMELNGFFSPGHEYVKADTMKFLGRIPDQSFDLCVCDPPTFSNSHSVDYDWDVQRCHVDLLTALAPKMSTGGVVYFSNNFRRFKLDETALELMYTIREITNRTIPEDFRNKHIHRCWRLVVK